MTWMNWMLLIHIVSMQDIQFLHCLSSFDQSFSMNTNTISSNTIDTFFYRFRPCFQSKTGNSGTPRGLCTKAIISQIPSKKLFFQLYTCAAVLFVCRFIRVCLSLSVCVYYVHTLWNFALDTALRGVFPFIGYVCVEWVRVFFIIVSFGKLHHFMLIAFLLPFYWKAILLIREFHYGEENKPLLFDLFRLLHSFSVSSSSSFSCLFYFSAFSLSKVTNNKGKCHFAMLSRMTVMYGQVMRNQSGSLNFANGQI